MNWLQKQRLKSKMNSVFHSGELYLKLRQDKKLIFSPEKVNEKEWIFKQAFGENMELKGSNKRFVLTVFNDSLNGSFNYSLY